MRLLRLHTGAWVSQSQAYSKSPPQHGWWPAKAASIEPPPQSNSYTLGVLKIMRRLGRLACSQEEESRREQVPRLVVEGLVSFLLSFWEGRPMAPVLWGFVQVIPCTQISRGAWLWPPSQRTELYSIRCLSGMNQGPVPLHSPVHLAESGTFLPEQLSSQSSSLDILQAVFLASKMPPSQDNLPLYLN